MLIVPKNILENMLKNFEVMLNIFKSFHEQEIYNFDYSNKKVLMNRTIVFLDWDNRNKLMSPFCGIYMEKEGIKSESLEVAALLLTLRPNPTKWSKTLVESRTNCLSVFNHFVGLVLKGLMMK